MDILEFSSLVFLGSLLAGFLGAATGLGGGVVIVPLLAIGFGVDIRYAWYISVKDVDGEEILACELEGNVMTCFE